MDLAQKIVTNALSDKDERTIVKLLKGLEELPLRDGNIVHYGFGSVNAGAVHNNYVFHSSGFQLFFGDMSLKDIDGLARLSKKYRATLFVLGEHDGSSVPKDDLVSVGIKSAALREVAVWKPAPVSPAWNRSGDDTNLVKPDYLRNNAWLVIKKGARFKREFEDGEVKWLESSWEKFVAWRLDRSLNRAMRG
jgi:hypothetical protein